MNHQQAQHWRASQESSDAVMQETSTDEMQQHQGQENVHLSPCEESRLPADAVDHSTKVDSNIPGRPDPKAFAGRSSPQSLSDVDNTATSNSSSWKSKVVHGFSKMSLEHRRRFWIADTESEELSRPWRTAFIRFGPLSGIFCMCLAVASIIASLGVLAGSDGQKTTSWQTPPSTLLAIFTAIANLSMRYAAIQGVVIAWWYRAMKGSTLAKLHYDWRSGSTLRGALTAGRHMGLLGLACIFSTVVVIDGPLLQRSSTVDSTASTRSPLPLNVSMAPEIPRGFTGVWARPSEIGTTYTVSAAFNETIPTVDGRASNYINCAANFKTIEAPLATLYRNNAPLTGLVSGCPNEPGTTCKAKIRAPALAATACISHQYHANHMAHFAGEHPILSSLVAPPLTNEDFIVDISLVIDGPREVVNVITAYSTMQNCTHGTLNLTVCSLESAIGEYEVTIDHRDIATLDSPGTPKIVARANNTDVNATFDAVAEGHVSTLAGIVLFAADEMFEYVFSFPQGGSPTGLAYGSLYQAYMKPDGGGCISFRDPHDDIVANLNKMMVYTGTIAAKEKNPELLSRMDPGLEMTTQITGYTHGPHNVFHTDYWFFFAATLVEVICIAFVAPTYWGWWRLGRPCSFSPLELSKAFESPMLNDCNSNSSGRDLAKTAGDVRVQYGAVPSNDAPRSFKIAFADNSLVSRPQNGMRFDV